MEIQYFYRRDSVVLASIAQLDKAFNNIRNKLNNLIKKIYIKQ